MNFFSKNNIIFSFILFFAACSASAQVNIQTIPTQNLQVVTPEKPVIKHTCDPYSIICVKSVTQEGRIEAFLVNKSFETRTVRLKVWNDNVVMELFVDDIKNVVISGKDTIKLADIQPRDPTKNYGYNFYFDSSKGKLEAVHDDNYIYDLPFETGKEYKVIQSYGGNFSHTNKENYYAYDFSMPVGSIVTAAREGIVIDVVERFNLGGRNPRMIDKSNYVYIEHPDGSVGVYGHLKHMGVIIKLGDKIQKGQNIAYSGNTGYVDSPHLHFSVGKFLKDSTIQSLPIKVNTTNGVISKLEKFEIYKKP